MVLQSARLGNLNLGGISMAKKAFALFFLALVLSFNSMAGDDIENCVYNEFSGKVIGKFSANERVKSRSWVPLDLILCQNDQGTFAIVSYQAVGLGVLWDPPFKTPTNKSLNAQDHQAVIQWGGEDDRQALKALDSKLVDVVILGGSSETQVTVFRKQLDRVVSNTLFGSFVK
jgi:hypothetical protein